MSDTGRVYYGWVIVGITFLTQFLVMGTVFYSYGILFKPLAEDLGGSRLAIGLALPILMMVAGLAAPFVGRAIDQRPIRGVMLLGAVLLGLGFFLLSRATSLWQLYLSFGVVTALGFSMLGGLPNATLVANWFLRRRGTALGISQIGISLSGMVMAYVTSWLVESYGWRGTAMVFAVAPAALLCLPVALLVANRPEDRGLHPDGVALGPEELAFQRRAEVAASSWTTTRALRERNLWIIAVVVGLNFACFGAVLIQIYPHATDQGYSAAQAASVLSAMAAFAALGKPVFGWLGDHLPRRPAVWLAIALQAIGVALVTQASSYAALLVAAVVFGLGYGGMMPLWGVLIGAVYGRVVFGRIMGLMGPIMLPFQTLGVPFSGWIFDRTGSYDAAFFTYLGAYLVAAFVLLFLRIPADERVAAPVLQQAETRP